MKGWVIPPKQSSEFVANMEQVLDVYKRPYNKKIPVVCMDESPKQLIKDVASQAIKPGQEARVDYKYIRNYMVNIKLDYIISNANGSVFLEISKSVFRKLEIQKPPNSLRIKFDKQVNPIFNKIRINSCQIRTLEKLRDTLLPKLMSGDVRVNVDTVETQNAETQNVVETQDFASLPNNK